MSDLWPDILLRRRNRLSLTHASESVVIFIVAPIGHGSDRQALSNSPCLQRTGHNGPLCRSFSACSLCCVCVPIINGQCQHVKSPGSVFVYRGQEQLALRSVGATSIRTGAVLPVLCVIFSASPPSSVRCAMLAEPLSRTENE